MRIRIIGDIDEEAFARFDEELTLAEKKHKDIDVILSSGGGLALDALAFHDRIKASTSNIHILAYGAIYSAAVLILAAGDSRRMSPNSWVMVHEDEVSLKKECRVKDAAKHILQSQRFEEQWSKLLAQSCSGTSEFWAKLHQKETYLTAQDCLKCGLIDEIL